MTQRRVIQLLVLLALALAPFGRMAAAEAHHAPLAMAAHCADQPLSDPGKSRRLPVDCMIACAAMAPAASSFLLPAPAAEAVPQAMVIPTLSGIRPEADPPPPRFA